MTKVTEDYAALSTKLGEVLAALQSPDITVDKALQLYGEGIKLAAAIEVYLSEAENKIEKLKLAALKVT